MSVDPYRYFRVEAHDLVDELQRGVLELDRQARSAEVVPRMLRAAHTLKSAARVVRQREMGDMAHALEDALSSLRDLDGPAPRSSIDVARALVTGLTERLVVLDPGVASTVVTPRTTSEDPFRVVRADVADVDHIVDGLANVHVELSSLRAAALEAQRVRYVAELLGAQLAPRAGEQGSAMDRTKASGMAEELRRAVGGLERRLEVGLERLERELVEVRESAEQLRLVPASVLLDVLERTARDATSALGRRIEFHASAGEVRLDAHMLTLVQGAMVQLVRNAVAHGIEPESERRAAGKPAAGSVTVEVTRHANRISFACRDDGRGVDLEAVRSAARRRGELEGSTDALGAAELLELLLGGGISTSAKVSAISGRGVGMDVVRDAAARLGGEVRVRTSQAHGTEVRLTVPVLLSALDVLLVEVNERTLAIPVEMVRKTQRIRGGDVARRTEGDAIVIDGRAITFVPLAQCLGLPVRRGPARAESAVLVAVGEIEAALAVDRLAGLAHVLVRPFPDLAPHDGLVAGVALDGRGDPILVLDPQAVLARARGASVEATPTPERTALLVVDDSLTTRMLEQSILEAAGYEVGLAVSGEDALAKLAARPYALLLVDVEMPGIDGFELIARMRADTRYRDIPAILVTSRNAREDRARGDAVRANGYMVKGEFDQAVLLARIAELVA